MANFSELFFCFYQSDSNSSCFQSVKLLNQVLITIISFDGRFELSFFQHTFKFNIQYPES